MPSSNAEAQLRRCLSVCGCPTLSEYGWVLGMLKAEGELSLCHWSRRLLWAGMLGAPHLVSNNLYRWLKSWRIMKRGVKGDVIHRCLVKSMKSMKSSLKIELEAT